MLSVRPIILNVIGRRILSDGGPCGYRTMSRQVSMLSDETRPTFNPPLSGPNPPSKIGRKTRPTINPPSAKGDPPFKIRRTRQPTFNPPSAEANPPLTQEGRRQPTVNPPFDRVRGALNQLSGVSEVPGQGREDVCGVVPEAQEGRTPPEVRS